MSDLAAFLPQDHAFGPDSVAAMSQAFVLVRKQLKTNFDVLLSDDSIAKMIIELANDGETDPNMLCINVLARYDIDGETMM